LLIPRSRISRNVFPRAETTAAAAAEAAAPAAAAAHAAFIVLPPPAQPKQKKAAAALVLYEFVSMELIEEITCWMNGLNIPMTSRRKQFLRRFQVLLILRGFVVLDRRSVQSAMEVILNLRRSSLVKQLNYLKAVIKNLDDCIATLLEKDIDENIEGALFFFYACLPFLRLSCRLGLGLPRTHWKYADSLSPRRSTFESCKTFACGFCGKLGRGTLARRSRGSSG
jgi:hypothetical protein